MRRRRDELFDGWGDASGYGGGGGGGGFGGWGDGWGDGNGKGAPVPFGLYGDFEEFGEKEHA